MSEATGPAPTTRPRILAVDDEPRSLELLVRALRREGEVVTAPSGDAACAELAAGEFDLVISDQRMPGMKGAEVLERAARRDERTARVLLTGYADMQATVDAINLGRVDAYVSKPWKPDQLALLARRLIERTRLVRRNEDLLKELEGRNAELEVAMAELRRAHHRIAAGLQVEAMGRTMAMVVHDLRGPLATIGAALHQLAGHEAELPESERIELAEIGRDEVGRMARMCEELLEVSRASGSGVQRDDTPLDEAVFRALEAVRREREDKAIALELELACEPSPRIDGERMQRVFLNLARNAVQAMEPAGTLRVESRCEGGTAHVAVRDTGPGIPESIRSSLFEPFVTFAKPGGFGLGLAIVRKIVEDHGGTVEVAPNAGPGTTFVVRLPVEG